MQLLGLAGDAGAGKDSVAQILVDRHGFSRFAFADAVRQCALALDPIVGVNRLSFEVGEKGWDRVKREIPEARRILQVVGTDMGRMLLGENVWVDIVAKKMALDKSFHYVITDMRFPNEVDFITEKGGITVRVTRPNNPHAIAKTHVSEQLDIECMFEIVNDSSLDDLGNTVDCLLEDLNGYW